MNTDKVKAQFALWCVKQVEHLLPAKSKQALHALEQFCHGHAINIANAQVIAHEAIQDAIYELNESAKDAAWAAYYAVCLEAEKAAKNAAAAIAYAAAPQPWNPKHIHAKQAALAAQERKRLAMLAEEKNKNLQTKHAQFLPAATASIEGRAKVINIVKDNDELLLKIIQFVISKADSNDNEAYHLRERMAQKYAAIQACSS